MQSCEEKFLVCACNNRQCSLYVPKSHHMASCEPIDQGNSAPFTLIILCIWDIHLYQIMQLLQFFKARMLWKRWNISWTHKDTFLSYWYHPPSELIIIFDIVSIILVSDLRVFFFKWAFSLTPKDPMSQIVASKMAK